MADRAASTRGTQVLISIGLVLLGAFFPVRALTRRAQRAKAGLGVDTAPGGAARGGRPLARGEPAARRLAALRGGRVTLSRGASTGRAGGGAVGSVVDPPVHGAPGSSSPPLRAVRPAGALGTADCRMACRGTGGNLRHRGTVAPWHRGTVAPVPRCDRSPTARLRRRSSIAEVDRITVADAARRLGVSPTTVRRRIATGHLAAERHPRPQGVRILVLWEEPTQRAAPASTAADIDPGTTDPGTADPGTADPRTTDPGADAPLSDFSAPVRWFWWVLVPGAAAAGLVLGRWLS